MKPEALTRAMGECFDPRRVVTPHHSIPRSRLRFPKLGFFASSTIATRESKQF